MIQTLATSCDGVRVQRNGRMCVQPSSNSSTSSNRNTSTSQNIALERDRGANAGGSAGNPVYVAGSRTVGENDLGTGNDGDCGMSFKSQ